MAPKSYQIAHIYCLFFLMVVVCIANRDTDNTVKASKFNKDIYINLAKKEEYKEMKKCILVWQVPFDTIYCYGEFISNKFNYSFM